MCVLAVFDAGCYYIMNIETLIDDHWADYIYPQLAATNGTMRVELIGHFETMHD